MAPAAVIEGSKVEVEEEKCGLDMSSYEDLPPLSVGVGVGVGGDCNGDGKDDYVIVNGSDAGSDDHGEAEGNGGLDGERLDVECANTEVVGEGDSGAVNGDGKFQNHNGDVALDDPGEHGQNGDLNSSGSRVENLEGGVSEFHTSDQTKFDDRRTDKVDNEIKLDSQASEVGDGINVGEEDEGKVEDGSLVKENGVVNSQISQIVDEDSQLAVENGLTSDADVKVGDLDVAEEIHAEIVPDGAEDQELCMQKGDDCNSSDAGSPDKDVVQDETSIVEAAPLVSDQDSEQQHLVDSQVYKDHDGNLETQIITGKPSMAQDDVQPLVAKAVNGDVDPLNNKKVDSKPANCDVECQSVVDVVLETQPLDCEVQGSNLSAGCEIHPVEAVSKEVSEEDAITDNQASEGQQEELQPADEGKELASNEAEAKVKELAELDASDDAVRQELDAEDSVAARFDEKQSEESAVKVQDVESVTTESHQIQVQETDHVQSEGVENQNDELGPNKSEDEVARQGDSEAVRHELNESEESEVEDQNASELTDSATHVDSSKAELTAEVEPETEKVDVEGKEDLITEVGGDKESPAVGSVVSDEVSEETEPVNDATGKEVSSQDLDSEKYVVVEEASSLPDIQSAKDAAVGEDGVDVGTVSGNHVDDTETVTVSVETSINAGTNSKSEESDSSLPVDNAPGLSTPSNADTMKEEVTDNGASAADTKPSASDPCPQPKMEGENGSLPDHGHNGNLTIAAANGDIEVADKSTSISSEVLKPKISFGSFVCEAPFSGNDASTQPDLSDRSIELTSGQSNVTGENSKPKIKPSNGVAILKAEANSVHHINLNYEKTSPEVLTAEQANTDEVSSSTLAASSSGAFKGQNTELARRPFYYLIRVPRYDDEKLKEQMRLTELDVQEKTRSRDAARDEYVKRKASAGQLRTELEAAKSKEKDSREKVKAKRREIDTSQSLVNLAKNALTVEDVHAQILNMERKIQHETLDLKEEKQLVRDIKQLKNLKDQLYGNSQKQEELKQALDQKDQVEEKLKVLRKELASLRDNLSKEEECVRVAKKRYDEECTLLNESFNKLKSADNVRQDAYANLQLLRDQWSEKNKHFRSYKDTARVADDFAAAGNKDSLVHHCVNQVEKFMEMWNKNDEFRKEYIKYNTRSTLRRLRTLDVRSLGPDEEPPSFRNASDDRATRPSKVDSVPRAVSTTERDFPEMPKNAEPNSSKKPIEQKNKKTAPPNKVPEVTTTNTQDEPSGRIEVEEVKEERKMTKEEEELARKAEEQRREEEEARLREQRRLEEKAKAQEALERKRRLAEKAQARAEFRARKEAEQKEKEREKRAKKKEKKNGIQSETTEIEPATPVETPSETTREPEVTEKPVTMTKKPQKPSLYTKQIKTTKSIPPPPPLRNRSKRRMQQWLWALATVVAVIALFFLGNSNFFLNNSLLGFGPGH